MTATSGPGLSLMSEGIGLAVQTEVPIVVLDVMRGGPSTGLAVKSEQSDLNIALHGLHGDAPHVVTAATSSADCLFTTQWSVYLAEAMQCPAVVLSNQLIGQARVIIDEPDEVPFAAERLTAPDGVCNYHRYAATASGISAMAIPGTPGGEHETNSSAHNARGRPSNRAEDHQEQLDKRLRKVTSFDYGDHWADVEGAGDTAIITWGACTGPSREALARAEAAGIDARLIAMRLLMPARTERLAEALDGIDRVLVVEQSHGRQFYHYLCAYFHRYLPEDIKVFSQPGPLPIRPGQVLEQLVNWS